MQRKRNKLIRGLSFAGACLAGVGGVAAQDSDPFGAPDSDPFGAVDAVVTQAAEAGACAQVSESACQAANTSFLLMAAGYLVLGLAVFVVLHMWWKGRGAHAQGLKFLLPLVLGTLAVGALVAFDPLASETYACCTSDSTYRAVLLLGDSPPARGAALGGAPFAILYVVLTIALTKLRNRRAR